MSSGFSNDIKAEARRLGFAVCGIARAEAVDEPAASRFKAWLSQGHQAGMQYMAHHLDLRLDPRRLMPGVESIVCVAMNYAPAQRIPQDEFQIAAYAYGQDYHDLVKQKLHRLADFIARHPLLTDALCTSGQTKKSFSYRAFSDSAPVLERYWAQRAGLGWTGRNHQLIIPHAGSMFFLGELFLNIRLEYDRPASSHCGKCSKCVEACPTHALQLTQTVGHDAPPQTTFNAQRCLSYQTIENRNDIPSELASLMGNSIFGCECCLQACPYNRFATPTDEPRLQPKPELLRMTKEKWRNLTEDEYRQLFKGSAVKRAKYSGLMRNIKATEHEQEQEKD